MYRVKVAYITFESLEWNEAKKTEDLYKQASEFRCEQEIVVHTCLFHTKFKVTDASRKGKLQCDKGVACETSPGSGHNN